MTETLITTEVKREHILAHIQAQKLPFRVAVREGVDRSLLQSQLAFKWYKEAGEQTGSTADEIRADCKLTLGVPIRREDDDFRAVYDEMFKPLELAQKLALMVEPFDFAVTRGMTTKQMARYLDAMWQRFVGEMGLKLTEPDPMVGEIRRAAE